MLDSRIHKFAISDMTCNKRSFGSICRRELLLLLRRVVDAVPEPTAGPVRLTAVPCLFAARLAPS